MTTKHQAIKTLKARKKQILSTSKKHRKFLKQTLTQEQYKIYCERHGEAKI